MRLYALLERLGYRRLATRVYGVEVTGAERVPRRGPAILVANHESLFDPWILALVSPRPVRYMAKSELWRWRLLGVAFESFGAFPVERGAGDRTAISRAAALLEDGELLGIFPQGTSKQHPERPFHRGAARLALTTGVPLIPVRLTGTRGVPRLWPTRRTRVHVGEPIPVTQARPTIAAARELTAHLERRIAEAPA